MVNLGIVRAGMDLSREFHGLAGDRGDQSSNELISVVDLGVAKVKIEEQRDAQSFQGRKNQGLENICKDCGAEITEARRKAVPFTMVCVSCKQEQESGRR